MASITLLSDFGLHDASAGAAKGMLLSTNPGARITDISHEVRPFQIKQGAYLLQTAFRSFPAGTVHLVIIDTFSEPLPKLVLCSYEGHYFLAPDNGIIPLALGLIPASTWLCFELTKEKSMTDWLSAAANTILLLQSQSPGEIGLTPHTLKTLSDAPSQQQAGPITCNVRYIDHYGNVVTDMTIDQFNKLNKIGRFTINFMRVNELTTILRHYNDVLPGDPLCRFNRSGYLEICVNQGSACSLFGFRVGGIHNHIKISFE